MNKEEKEKDGWNKWTISFPKKKKPLILLNFTDQFKFQAVETFE